MIDFMLVAIGGFFGAISRALISKKYNNKYPLKHLGTFLVNIVGSLLLGIIIHLHIYSNINSFLGIGFLGAFTTFSTFKVEIITLMQSQKRKQLFLYLSMTYVLGICMAGIGFWISGILNQVP